MSKFHQFCWVSAHHLMMAGYYRFTLLFSKGDDLNETLILIFWEKEETDLMSADMDTAG